MNKNKLALIGMIIAVAAIALQLIICAIGGPYFLALCFYIPLGLIWALVPKKGMAITGVIWSGIALFVIALVTMILTQGGMVNDSTSLGLVLLVVVQLVGSILRLVGINQANRQLRSQSGYPGYQGGYPGYQGGYPDYQGGYAGQQQGGYPGYQGGYIDQNANQGGYPGGMGGYIEDGNRNQGGYPSIEPGEQGQVYCRYCGAQLNPNSTSCYNCGSKVN